MARVCACVHSQSNARRSASVGDLRKRMDFDDASRLELEVEALESIYGSDALLKTRCQHTNKLLKLDLTRPIDSQYNYTLTLTLNTNYPIHSLPNIRINSQLLDKTQKNALEHEIITEHQHLIGEEVIFLFCEWLDHKMIQFIPSNEQRPGVPRPQTESIPKLDTNRNQFDILHGIPIQDRKSTFQAHLACIQSIQHIPQVLSQLYENNKIASASHNSYAYRIQSQSNNNSLQCVRRLAFHPQLCFRSASSAISSTQSIIFVVVSECRTMTMMARNQQANVFSIFLKLRM
uniref:RWD domain-containing protein n=1 Tax=Timspurckia oligopyrenoides TaxID=708627 RepID=A0A7S1ETY7_9RHOD